MSETELRRLRDRVATRKHFEDAFNACQARLVPAEYLSVLFDVYYVATNGVTRGGESVDSGHAESKPPSYDRRAMSLLVGEQQFLAARSQMLLGKLDGIVGEAA